MKIETLKKIAKLSQIKLEDSEQVELVQQLATALEYFDQVQSVDTKNVQALVQPIEETLSLRQDVVSKDCGVEQGLSNAISRQGHLFSVPPVV